VNIPVHLHERVAAYTLACHHLLLASNNPAIPVEEVEQGVEACVDLFDDAVAMAIKHAPAGTVAEEVARNLIDAARQIHDPAITAVFDIIAREVRAGAALWDPSLHLAQLHSTGQILAQRLYQLQAAPLVHSRFHHVCPSRVEYDVTVRPLGTPLMRGERRDDTPCICYNPPNTRGCGPVGEIVLYFSERSNFTLYLALPYLFMHEYASHVFPNDYDSEWFNDGWLVYAQAWYLEANWMVNDLPVRLHPRQGDVQRERLRGSLVGPTSAGYALAKDLWGLLGWQPCLRITCELAEFVPQPGEDDVWLTYFLQALSRAMKSDIVELRTLVNTGDDIRTLMSKF